MNTSFQFWFQYLKNRKLTYFLGFLSVLFVGLSQVLSPRILGWLIDFLKDKPIPTALVFSTKSDTFSLLFLLFIFSLIGILLGRMGWRYFLARETHKANTTLKRDIWNKVRFLPMKKLQRDYPVGQLMNLSTSDAQNSKFIFGFTLVAASDVLFLGLSTFFMMIYINLEMTLWTLIIVPIIPFFIAKLAKKEGDVYEQSQDYLSRFNDSTSQAVSTIKLQRLTQTGNLWEKKLVHSANEYRKKREDSVKTSMLYIPLMGSNTLFSYIILFGIGVFQVVNNKMSVGDFVTMQSLVFLIQDPLAELGFIISEFKQGFTSLNRITEVKNEPSSKNLSPDGIDVVESTNIFYVKNLKYRYDDGNRYVLEDLNFQVRKNQRLGITGPVGSGKSTLIKILSGFERNFQGEVLLNGRNFDAYSHPALRTYLSVVPQKTFLFASSIKKNVMLDQDLSDDEVWYYLRLAGLENDVKNFPDGLETGLGEWGINLSGGQKQRLTLARALAKNPEVLIFDDCLSAVDSVTEEKILSNLDKNLKDTTLIWAAHRKSTLKYCDQILEL